MYNDDGWCGDGCGDDDGNDDVTVTMTEIIITKIKAMYSDAHL